MKKLLIYILTAFTVLTLPASAKIPASQRIRLTDQWEYLKGDLGSIWEAVRAVAPGSSEAVPIWQPVTLPHCFNAEDAVDPDDIEMLEDLIMAATNEALRKVEDEAAKAMGKLAGGLGSMGGGFPF